MDEPINTLVVDDEEGICFFLTETLQGMGYTVTSACSGESALDHLLDTRFDLVLLDLRLGGRIDGLRVLESIRWRWPQTVVIIMTAHATLDSALAAIREGVDGYLLKPVEPEQVRQAVRDALRRRQSLAQPPDTKDSEHMLQRGPVLADLHKRQVTLEGQPVDLVSSEFDLLIYLIQNAHRVVPPPELVKAVLGYEPTSMQEARDTIKWYVHRLRRKIEPNPSAPRYIINVSGVGYTFKE